MKQITTRKTRRAALAAAAVAATLAPASPALALFGTGPKIVFDPGNFAQHLAILQQHAAQLARLQEQVEAMGRMLKDWDYTRIDETIGRMQQIHGTLDQIANGLGHLGDRFPQHWDDRDPDASIAPAQRQWRVEQRTRGEQTVQLHQQVADSMAETRERVAAYVANSNAAPGQLAAQQATNELLAVQIQQAQEMQALEIAALRQEMEAAAAEASDAEWSAGLREASGQSNAASAQRLRSEDTGPNGH